MRIYRDYTLSGYRYHADTERPQDYAPEDIFISLTEHQQILAEERVKVLVECAKMADGQYGMRSVLGDQFRDMAKAERNGTNGKV